VYSPYPTPPIPSRIIEVATSLDPALTPLGFAAGQPGGAGQAGQVIFCRGNVGSEDGSCIDLVIDVELSAEWRITDVRYWGFPSDRWHLAFDREAGIADQLEKLARTLPGILGLAAGGDG